MGDKILGIEKAEVRRQLIATEVDVDPESKFSPLKKGKGIELCVEGGKKILSDPQTREMIGRVYRGE